ncbi:MAG: murein biosynthesis integral membrane protein MurJ [Myxococcota bacterium]|nr:murein biosynthesis integral membrane protein MurJ [Myxococcota bacterium]
MSPEATSRPKASRIPFVAALLAGSALFSGVLGVLREAVLASFLGATPAADAYTAAFQIPDILFHFLSGGAFAVAFVPFFTRVRAERGGDDAQRLLATVFGTMTVVSVAATVALWVAAEPLVAVQFPRFAPETQALTVRLTRIVLPAQIFFVIGGVVRAALMANDRFATQALAPIVYNVGIIAGGLLLGPTLGAEGFAWGALAGAVVGPFLIPYFDLRRAGLRLGFRFAPLDADFRAYLWLAAPLILGLSLLTVDEWYDRWFGQLGGVGAVASLRYARRVMLLPVAVVGQAVATAALPALSQLWSEGRREELDRVLLATLRATLGLALLMACGAFAVAEPTVAILFERGAFTANDTARVASLLRIFVFALPAWVVIQVAGRGFYAREDMWRPMLLGTAVALLAAPLYWALARRFGAEGVAAAGAIAMTANVVALLWMLRRVYGGPRLGPLVETFARALVLGALAALPAALAVDFVGGPTVVRFLAGAFVFAIIAVPGVWVVGDEAMREAILALLRRVRRKRE